MKTIQMTSTLALVLSLAACDGGEPKQDPGKQAAKAEAAQPEAKADAKTDPKTPAEPAATASAAINLDAEGRALAGFDPVAYHAGEALEGKAEHTFDWSGGTWQFASAENKAKFEAEPDKYAPQNGGYCTFGVVVGKKFDGDPKVWHLSGDKLYVFLNDEVKGKFLQDETGNLDKVATNWPAIKDKLPSELEG